MKREIAKSRPESRPRPRQRRDFFLGFMFEPWNWRELSNFTQSRSRSRREDFSSVRDPARSLSRPIHTPSQQPTPLKSQELCVPVEILGRTCGHHMENLVRVERSPHPLSPTPPNPPHPRPPPTSPPPISWCVVCLCVVLQHHTHQSSTFFQPPPTPVCVWCVSCSAAVPARRPDLFNAGWAGTARRAGSYWSPIPLLAYRRRKKWCLYAIQLRGMTSCRHGSQCCQVAEIPAKKLKRGRRKKKFVAEFRLILPKTGRKGGCRKFSKKFLIFSCDNHV